MRKKCPKCNIFYNDVIGPEINECEQCKGPLVKYERKYQKYEFPVCLGLFIFFAALNALIIRGQDPVEFYKQAGSLAKGVLLVSQLFLFLLRISLLITSVTEFIKNVRIKSKTKDQWIKTVLWLISTVVFGVINFMGFIK